MSKYVFKPGDFVLYKTAPDTAELGIVTTVGTAWHFVCYGAAGSTPKATSAETLTLMSNHDVVAYAAKLQSRLINAEAKSDVMGGEWCQANRDAGRGPCGACVICCDELRTKHERLRRNILKAINNDK